MSDAWPTKGDDINPMENLWAILDERLQGRKYSTLAGMKKIVRAEWDVLGQDIIDNLIDSIPSRLRRVREASNMSFAAGRSDCRRISW